MKPLAAWLLTLALPCANLTGKEQPAPPRSDGFRVVCDGIVSAALTGQDLIYSGRSEFRWGGLQVVVDGQVHVFCGVSLQRNKSNDTRARGEIQSITANGPLTVTWREGNQPRGAQGNRLVIRPASSPDETDLITLDGRVDASGKAIPGAVSWDCTRLRWTAREAPENHGKK